MYAIQKFPPTSRKSSDRNWTHGWQAIGEEMFSNYRRGDPADMNWEIFARNIQRWQACDEKVKCLCHTGKTSKDSWQVNVNNASSVVIKYNYYAAQLDAGELAGWMSINCISILFIVCSMFLNACMNIARYILNYQWHTSLRQRQWKNCRSMWTRIIMNWLIVHASPTLQQ